MSGQPAMSAQPAMACATLAASGELLERNSEWLAQFAERELRSIVHPLDLLNWNQSEAQVVTANGPMPRAVCIRVWSNGLWQRRHLCTQTLADGRRQCWLLAAADGESSASGHAPPAPPLPTELVGNVVHSFNNYLSAMMGFCELALFDIDSNHPSYSQLQTVLDSGNNAVMFTRDLLAIARRSVLQKDRLDSRDWLLPILNSYPVKLQGEIPSVAIDTDTVASARVLHDIFRFFADAAPSGLSVQVRQCSLPALVAQPLALRAGEFLRIDIRDQSAGMSVLQAQQLFEPYFSTKAVRAQKGIGLAPAYGIWRQFGGFAGVFSEVNVGNHVVLLYPLAPSEEPLTPALVATGAAASAPRFVPVVTPFPLVALLAHIDLAKSNQVPAWLTPEEAAQSLAELDVDLILTSLTANKLVTGPGQTVRHWG